MALDFIDGYLGVTSNKKELNCAVFTVLPVKKYGLPVIPPIVNVIACYGYNGLYDYTLPYRGAIKLSHAIT